MNKKFVLAIGSRARQGKDSVSNFIKELRPNDEVHILHWADAVYEEVKNADRRWPLICRMDIGKDIYYNLLHTPYSRNYILYKADEIPVIHDLMHSRCLEFYWGMDEKDAPILQAWGTDFRRQKISEDYWVDRTAEKMAKIVEDFNNKCDFEGNPPDHNLYICIADTRFKNEYNYVRHQTFAPFEPWWGEYVKVVRLNEDGTQYIDPGRDPKHPSEIDLDGVPADFTLEAKTGDLETLKKKTIELLDALDQRGK